MLPREPSREESKERGVLCIPSSIYPEGHPKFTTLPKRVNSFVEGELRKYKRNIEARFKQSKIKEYTFQVVASSGSNSTPESKKQTKSFDSRGESGQLAAFQPSKKGLSSEFAKLVLKRGASGRHLMKHSSVIHSPLRITSQAVYESHLLNESRLSCERKNKFAAQLG